MAAGLAFRPAAEEVRQRLQKGREQAQEAGRFAAQAQGRAPPIPAGGLILAASVPTFSRN